ncbi:MAG: hypothetical protein HKN47_14215 [Pirellulaceae bacterium]|nr:hypothetical protein [Pirellulaceae bacterium]
MTQTQNLHLSAANHDLRDDQTTDEGNWDHVRQAIADKWPHINQAELQSVESNPQALADFVSPRVDASRDEVESLIAQHHDQWTLENAKQIASEQYERTTEAIGQAYRRAEQTVRERPAEASAVAFISGIIVGALATSLLMTSRPQPTMWDNVRNSYRRG